MSGPARPAATRPAAVPSPAPDEGKARDSLAQDDPHGALRIALSALADPAIRPEDLLLDWLIGLADAVDPAGAARRIVAVADLETVRNDRLLSLLAQVAQWPLPRLARLDAAGARAGRRVRHRIGQDRM